MFSSDKKRVIHVSIRAGEMAQCGRHLSCKPSDLNWIQRIHVKVFGENQLQEAVFWPPYMLWHAYPQYIYEHMHVYTLIANKSEPR